MDLWIIILASFVVSLISFSGALLFVLKDKQLQKYMILFVALAAGTLLGAAFLHLLPESIAMYQEANPVPSEHNFPPSTFLLFGVLSFYVIEKLVRWHHHHDIDCHNHSLSTLSIIGDGFHNFLDGVVIAAAFLVDIRLGIITTIAVILHEIPQEIADLSLLLHSGWTRTKALFWNFVSALFSVLGAVIAYFSLDSLQGALPLLISFTAGAFTYIALADIVPSLHGAKHGINRWMVSGMFFLGILMIFVLGMFFPS